MPVYVSSISVFGNKACLNFTSDFFTNTGFSSSTQTLFVVATKTNSTTSVCAYAVASTTSTLYTDSTKWTYWSGFKEAAEGSTINSSSVGIVRYNSLSSADLRSQSGAWANFDPHDSYATAAKSIIGSNNTLGQYWPGYIGEILLYNSALSDADVNRVGSYLAARWNFTWTNL
jgi:hypothetical protein